MKYRLRKWDTVSVLFLSLVLGLMLFLVGFAIIDHSPPALAWEDHIIQPMMYVGIALMTGPIAFLIGGAILIALFEQKK